LTARKCSVENGDCFLHYLFNERVLISPLITTALQYSCGGGIKNLQPVHFRLMRTTLFLAQKLSVARTGKVQPVN
jgi:hypothetical protein